MRETVIEEMEIADKALENLKKSIFAKKSANFDKEEMLLIKSLHSRAKELLDIVIFSTRGRDE